MRPRSCRKRPGLTSRGSSLEATGDHCWCHAPERGGGLVEAYPIAHWTHGRGGSADALYVQGVGSVAPAHGSFGNVSTTGTVSMFEKEGFKAVEVFGASISRSSRIRAWAPGDTRP